MKRKVKPKFAKGIDAKTGAICDAAVKFFNNGQPEPGARLLILPAEKMAYVRANGTAILFKREGGQWLIGEMVQGDALNITAQAEAIEKMTRAEADGRPVTFAEIVAGAGAQVH